MNSFRKIVVAINYTDSCRHALWQAHHLARQSGATLHAIHVISDAQLNDFVDFFGVQHEMLVGGALSSLESFVKDTIGETNRSTCSIREGTPYYEVIAFANESKADLLVVGTDEYAPKPKRSGQFTIRCLRFANMPVLMVRNHSDHPFSKIKACIDLSNSTKPVLENASRINSGPDQKIEIVHACTPPWLARLPTLYIPEFFPNRENKEQWNEILDGELNGIKERAARHFQTPPTIIRLEHEDVEFALLNHLESSQNELAIIGRCGKGAKGIKTDLLGGIAESLIRNAHCSLLIVPVI